MRRRHRVLECYIYSNDKEKSMSNATAQFSAMTEGTEEDWQIIARVQGLL